MASQVPEDSQSDFSLSVERQIDAICDQYECVLAGAQTLPFEEYLERIRPEGRRSLLAELIGLAFERLDDLGIVDAVEVLAAAHPQHDAAIRSAWDAKTAYYDREGEAGAQTALHSAPTPRRRSRSIRIRCPQCSNHLELLVDLDHDSVPCSTCGGTINVVDRGLDTRQAASLQRVSRFDLISRIGVGGFGSVWKARDTELDRTVALKIPRHGNLQDEDYELFFREARSVAQLQHPAIVPVHEVGREGDIVFIVSDLIRGESLGERISGGDRLPSIQEAVALVRDVADAVHHAHERGVIHRDLKPANIMLDAVGKPHVMDFGLAKRTNDAYTMTEEGHVVGTPAYMSPEQAEGHHAWIDRRSDIYSLGVILYQLVAGRLPFDGGAQQQIKRRTLEDPKSLRDINSCVSRDLANIVTKAMQREPGRRYNTAADFAADLGRYLRGEPVRARPIPVLERAYRWAGRNQAKAAAIAAITALAVVSTAAAATLVNKNQRLKDLNAEKDNLILLRESEVRQIGERASGLQTTLDAWEGRANPWSFWPPTPKNRPAKAILDSLNRARRDYLVSTARNVNAPSLDRGLADLVLAEIAEADGNRDAAVRWLEEAATNLSEPISDGGASDLVQQQLGLADTYARLSAMVSPDSHSEGSRLLKKSIRALEECHLLRPHDPSTLLRRVDGQLRLPVFIGAEEGTEFLEEAMQLQKELNDVWPESARALYRLACEASGRFPTLILTD